MALKIRGNICYVVNFEKINYVVCIFSDTVILNLILSSNFDTSLPSDAAFAGEIGLSGEIRPVSQIEKRIAEAAKLGMKKIFISSYNTPQGKPYKGLQVVQIATVAELVKQIF